MTKKVINIIKLCVGAQNVSELYNWQKNRMTSVANLEDPVTFIITRMRPKKEEELLNGALESTNEWYAIAKIAGIKLCEALRKQYNFDAIY